MTLLNYSKTEFLKDLCLLDFTCPNSNQTLDFSLPYITPSTRFFGGYQWGNVENDLSKIKVENRKFFCICLFTLVSADENMYTHFKENYDNFNRITNYPKFGWLGFGIHYEKPCYLLTAPKKIDLESIPEIQIRDFIHYQFEISANFLGNITPIEFFSTMINDVDFNCDNLVFKMISQHIKNNIFSKL